MIMTDRKEKSRRKQGSDHRGEDIGEYVDRKVSKAMKQMEEAMRQAGLAEKATRKIYKETKDLPDGTKFTKDKQGIKIIHNGNNGQGNLIFMENVDNVQVGCHNNVVINKVMRSSSRRHRDEEEDEAADRQTKTQQLSPEAQERLQEVLDSMREVDRDDVTIVSQHVGRNWRRLFRHLNLEDSQIEQLQQDFQGEGLKQIIYEGVLTWTRQESYRATVSKLANALRDTGHMDALRHLRP